MAQVRYDTNRYRRSQISRLTAQQKQFVAALVSLKGSCGNKKLRAKLGWGKFDYDSVKNQLLKSKVIDLGKGRGGSVSLAQSSKKLDSDDASYGNSKSIVAPASSSAHTEIDYEAELWKMAHALRGSMDSSDYKHVVLGLIFLKYVSDAFEELHDVLMSGLIENANPEDRDHYRAADIFWVPATARWQLLSDNARQSNIGELVDEAMVCIENENPALKGVLPKEYGRVEQNCLGKVIDLISDIKVGDAQSRSKDVLGRVYEYFLSQFASAEGKKGGEFYTPKCIVRLLVEMLEPFKGRVYDPCCGSSGMFVQSAEFISAHATGNGNGGKVKADIMIYGQELSRTTWQLAKMNLAIRGIDGLIYQGDSFHNDLHPDLKADFILANPPLNIKDWGASLLQGDKRWKYGEPPKGNANFAWVQHILHHLKGKGFAGFVLSNGSLSSNQSNEGKIRKALVEADLVDCIVSLPDKLFYSTQIPACLWFLSRNRINHKHRDRRGSVLFVDCRNMGKMVDRTHRELSGDEIDRISSIYHLWRGDDNLKTAAGSAPKEYENIPGFCMSASVHEISECEYSLVPSRYVGAAPLQEDVEPFESKMKRLAPELFLQLNANAELDSKIKTIIEGITSEN